MSAEEPKCNRTRSASLSEASEDFHPESPQTGNQASRGVRGGASTEHSAPRFFNRHWRPSGHKPGEGSPGIRDYLRKWQELHGESSGKGPMNVPNPNSTLDPAGNMETPLSSDMSQETSSEMDDEYEDCEPSASEPDGERVGSDLFISPGDLVQLPTRDEPTFGQGLAVNLWHTEKRGLYYDMHGRFIYVESRFIPFSVSGFMSVRLLDELASHIPTDHDPMSIPRLCEELTLRVTQTSTASVIKKLRGFGKESLNIYRAHHQAFDNVHDLVADETEVRFMTLEEIARMVMGISSSQGPLSGPILHATHLTLMKTPYGFSSSIRRHRDLGTFQVTPKREVRLIKTVEGWFRDYMDSLAKDHPDSGPLLQEDTVAEDRALPVRSFLDTARSLISRSRQLRITTSGGDVGPSIQKEELSDPTRPVRMVGTGYKFTETEQQIIAFFQAWSSRHQLSRSVSSNSLGSLILRATGMYGKDSFFARSLGFTFLQEIGVYRPWEVRTSSQPRLGLPDNGLTTTTIPTASPSSHDETELKDSMSDMRTDWKDLDVYCVDGASTEDIDDGISVQRVPGAIPSFWIHIHIAHPTAYMSPDHALARQCRRQGSSVYRCEGVSHMLPSRYVARWGLKADRATLTVSARVDEEGRILETNLRPGFIRKATFLTPATLSEVMASAALKADPFVVTVGGPMPMLPRPRDLRSAEDLSASQKDDLRLLGHLALQRNRRLRNSRSSFNVGNGLAIRAYTGPEREDASTGDRDEARFWQGDPIIELTARRWDSLHDDLTGEPGEWVIQELMMMAGEVTALWCRDRGIPIPYRGGIEVHPRLGVLPPVAETPASSLGLPDARKSVSPSTYMRFDYFSTPVPHRAVGVVAYTQVTSPLRRFADMVAHWQIDAALRWENQKGRSLVGSAPADYLPFSRADLDAVLVGVRRNLYETRQVQRYSKRHWLCQLLLRAQHQPTVLPATMVCYATAQPWGDPQGMIIGRSKLFFGAVHIEPTPWLTRATVQEHDEFEVELSSVQCQRGHVTMKPIRRIRRGSEQSELERWRMTAISQSGVI